MLIKRLARTTPTLVALYDVFVANKPKKGKYQKTVYLWKK
jgi:hypothetical protein